MNYFAIEIDIRMNYDFFTIKRTIRASNLNEAAELVISHAGMPSVKNVEILEVRKYAN